jgi:hypothetical protein
MSPNTIGDFTENLTSKIENLLRLYPSHANPFEEHLSSKRPAAGGYLIQGSAPTVALLPLALAAAAQHDHGHSHHGPIFQVSPNHDSLDMVFCFSIYLFLK